MYPCINRNARPNNNQLITYYLSSYLQRIQQYPSNTTYNRANCTKRAMWGCRGGTVDYFEQFYAI